MHYLIVQLLTCTVVFTGTCCNFSSQYIYFNSSHYIFGEGFLGSLLLYYIGCVVFSSLFFLFILLLNYIVIILILCYVLVRARALFSFSLFSLSLFSLHLYVLFLSLALVRSNSNVVSILLLIILKNAMH